MGNGHYMSINIGIANSSQMPPTNHVWEVIMPVYLTVSAYSWILQVYKYLPISGTSAKSFLARMRLRLGDSIFRSVFESPKEGSFLKI